MSLHPTSVLQVTTFIAVALVCISGSALGATQGLPDDEVQTLKIIGNKLGKKWNTSADPCQQTDGQITTDRPYSADVVVCDCTYANSTVCHVVSIAWKTQYLQGILPPELVNLTYLRNFDVTRNYLNGTIPSEWGAMPSIVNISLGANRLTGLIPKELGNVSTLQKLVVEMNQLSGPLPLELGNLPKIKRLMFSSNNFTGELPSSFAKLVTLVELRLADNNFTGEIPNFIQNFTDLSILVIQASGLKGPIPGGIELLENLTMLIISDLSGPEKQFPQLKSPVIGTLILRSCNLSGHLPEDLPYGEYLVTFDVSFNKLSGSIPSSYLSFRLMEHLYLTGNQLSGPVPNSIFEKGGTVDITYNNFTKPSQCKDEGAAVNLFAVSSMRNSSGILPCPSKRRCSKSYYNLYINCGGDKVKTRGKKYDGDKEQGASSKFFSASEYHWVYSTTGHLIQDERPNRNTYIWSDQSKLSIKNPELYMTARLSPLSLTYYAFCLMNGNYTLRLHFAEIMFTDDNTFRSLGRRIFDVYVQGRVALKDFNIASEAGGAGKEIVKPFNVMVTDNTLEIRFYWAGKGTFDIPYRGVYGPLISAISLDPNFDLPTEISTGVVVGIVVAILCFVLLIVVILWWQGCFGRKDTMEKDLRGLDLKTGSFTLRQIKAATNNFDCTNKIGEGGFGSVYKGFLVDGTVIAVKQLSTKSNQGNREFVNEIGMISALQHPHLVKLYGCCIEENQLLLVYQYMENNSLARALFGPKEHQLKLDWPTRHGICVGIARGLAYLHEESRLKIVHRDIKATNVLLDKDLIPKISDFGLAKLAEEDNTHISTRVAGTFGYMAPEYAMRGHLTDKADVYSFGIVTLEIISGKCNTSGKQKNECFYLLDWANMLQEMGDLMELVDPRLGSDFDKEEAMMMINVALLCTNMYPTIRPAMSSVVSMLEGRIKVEAPSQHASIIIDEAKRAAMRKHFRDISRGQVSENAVQSSSIETPQSISILGNDLYPLNLDSYYLLNRD